MANLGALQRAYAEGFSRCRGYSDNVRQITGWVRCSLGQTGAAVNRDIEWLAVCDDLDRLELCSVTECTWVTLWNRDPEVWCATLGNPFRTCRVCIRAFHKTDWPYGEGRIIRDVNLASSRNLYDMQGLITKDMFKDSTFRLGVMSLSGRIVSSARAAMGGNGIWIIDNLVTVAEHRGQGHARAVVHALLSEGQALGAQVSIVVADLKAISFYKKLGFREHAAALTFRSRAPKLFF
jgi:GNAT superfamily N-acetyltransferase